MEIKAFVDIMDKIIVVIVLYKTKLEESITFISLNENLKSINSQADLLIYDNSPERCTFDNTEKFSNWKITYIHDPANPGISKAYNVASHLGKRLNKDWLLVADQDTNFPQNTLATYLKNINNFPNEKLFAPILKANSVIISPTRYIFKRGFHLKKVKPGIMSLSFVSPVNSGLLINIPAFEEVGGYNEKVKLDFSDFQFIERFRKHFSQFVLMNIICTHGISTMDNNTLNSSLTRYGYYCEGAYFSAESKKEKVIYTLITFLRALSLTKKFKTMIFLKEHFKFWKIKW